MADQILTVARTRMAGLKRPLSWLALSAVVAGSVGLAGPAAAQRSTVAVHAGSTAAPRAAAARANPANRLGVVKPAMACSQLATLDLAGMTGVPVLIGSAATTTTTPGGWPACDVVGNIGPQEQFEAFLPTSTWRQLYLQTGCGGLCGAVSITAEQATGCVPLTSGQFVMASDNEGHYGTATFVPATFDATFGADPQLREYFGHLSEHVLAVFMKKLIKIFYGMSPARSFYDGCSGGGREALVEAQQWPRDFNGIVAGAPASITQPLSVWDSAWNALANLGPHGQPILTAAKLPVLHAAAVKACGRLNGLVMDPMTCTFNPATVQCPPHATSTASCLTAAQVTVARKLYEGPRDAQGTLMYPGWQVPGSELNWIPWVLPPPGIPLPPIDTLIALNHIRYLAHRGINPRLGLGDVPFTAAGFHQIMNATGGTFDATNPDLTAFRDAGGKLILYHGLADPAISPIGTIAYYQAVEDHMGGPAATEKFARLFLMPGMGHCSGGQGPNSFDALTAIIKWAEQGAAPKSLLTTQQPSPGNPVRSLPAYPYPLMATYNGTGSVDVASSYHAALPAKPFNAHIHWLGSFSPSSPRQ
jgi:Tannase and feruloyl esterase